MILIIGGKGAGKLDYLRSLGYRDEDIAVSVLDEKPALHGLEEIIFAAPERAMEFIPKLREKEAITCCETGSGIIPVDKKEREGREATGRVCAALAKEAERVIRLVCGIPTVIK